MKNKYHAKKTVIDGITFDSKAEAKFYLVLLAKKNRGKIAQIVLHPRYEILDAYNGNGQKLRKKSYTADFIAYDSKGRGTVYEVKSKATAKARDYVLRKQLFLLKYGDRYDFEEVIM